MLCFLCCIFYAGLLFQIHLCSKCDVVQFDCARNISVNRPLTTALWQTCSASHDFMILVLHSVSTSMAS